jgi:hypothetical protein
MRWKTGPKTPLQIALPRQFTYKLGLDWLQNSLMKGSGPITAVTTAWALLLEIPFYMTHEAL